METAAPPADPRQGGTPPPDDPAPDAGQDAGQTAGEPGVDVPEADDKPSYIVLCGPPTENRDQDALRTDEATLDSISVDTVVAVVADGQRNAKLAAIEKHPELDDRVSNDGILIAAVPFSSWHPTVVQDEPQPAKRRGL